VIGDVQVHPNFGAPCPAHYSCHHRSQEMVSCVDKSVQVCYPLGMKLSPYATKQGISYHTALRWFRAGTIKGYQAPTGTIIVTEGAVAAPTPHE
jgi:hypothetical protein